MQCDVAWHAAERASPTVYDQDALKPLRCTSSPGCNLTSQLILKNRPLKERTPRTVFALPHEDRAADYAAPTERNPNRLQPSADPVTDRWPGHPAGEVQLVCHGVQSVAATGRWRCVVPMRSEVGTSDWLVALHRSRRSGIPGIAVVERSQGLRQQLDWSSMRRPRRTRQLRDARESGSSHVVCLLMQPLDRGINDVCERSAILRPGVSRAQCPRRSPDTP